MVNENFKEKLLCVLLIDTSASMSGNSINLLNDVLKIFHEDILSDSEMAEELEIAIVTFDANINYMQCPALVTDFTMPTFIALSGGSDMVSGINKSIEIIRERKKYYNDNGISYRRPCIVMITDGDTNVDSIKEQVKQDGIAKRYYFLPIAANEDANLDVLNSLATDHALFLNGLRLSCIFKWKPKWRPNLVTYEANVALQPEFLNAYFV